MRGPSSKQHFISPHVSSRPFYLWFSYRHQCPSSSFVLCGLSYACSDLLFIVCLILLCLYILSDSIAEQVSRVWYYPFHFINVLTIFLSIRLFSSVCVFSFNFV